MIAMLARLVRASCADEAGDSVGGGVYVVVFPDDGQAGLHEPVSKAAEAVRIKRPALPNIDAMEPCATADN